MIYFLVQSSSCPSDAVVCHFVEQRRQSPLNYQTHCIVQYVLFHDCDKPNHRLFLIGMLSIKIKHLKFEKKFSRNSKYF